MKDKNKKKYIFSGILILLLIIIVIIFVIRNNKNNNENPNNEISNEAVENIPSNKIEEVSKVINIKSTKENPIEKDNVEVTNVEIIDNFGDLQVTSTLKNNNSEELNGFFIEIDFLDEDGNVVTSIAENSEQKVKQNEEFTFYNSVVELNNAGDIVTARISFIEKSSTKNSIENAFDEMDEDVNEMDEDANEMMEGK